MIKKTFFIFSLVAIVVSAQQVKKTVNNNVAVIQITDTSGDYIIAIDSVDLNKTEAEQRATALIKYNEIKLKEANPPPPTYIELRRKEYPPIGDQLDMIYWDKKNGTNKWFELIDSIKAKYPKQ